MTTPGRPKSTFLWLRAETFIHVGSGQQASLIDLPFVREGATGYPYIPGSGMKGALRDAARLVLQKTNDTDPTSAYFGKQDQAGPILVSDARLAFLPVRSLSSSYRYVTGADLMRRLKRDREFAGAAGGASGGSDPCQMTFCGPDVQDTTVFLEEFPFICQGDATAFDPLLADLPSDTSGLVKKRIAVLSDDDFEYFASHGLHVRTRNKLDEKTKTVDGGGLWSEESLPPDTLMYVMLTPRLHNDAGTLAELEKNVLQPCGGYVQVGGNETVGEGWFKILNLTTAAGLQADADGGEDTSTSQKEAA